MLKRLKWKAELRSSRESDYENIYWFTFHCSVCLVVHWYVGKMQLMLQISVLLHIKIRFQCKLGPFQCKVPFQVRPKLESVVLYKNALCILDLYTVCCMFVKQTENAPQGGAKSTKNKRAPRSVTPCVLMYNDSTPFPCIGSSYLWPMVNCIKKTKKTPCVSIKLILGKNKCSLLKCWSQHYRCIKHCASSTVTIYQFDKWKSQNGSSYPFHP